MPPSSRSTVEQTSCRHRRSRRTIVATAGALTALLVLSACGGQVQDEASDASAEADTEPAQDPEAPGSADTDVEDEPPAEQPLPEPELRLVATLAPLADLVAQVGGERVEVAPLVPAGADAHTYEPRPQDVVILDEADAYLGIGLSLNDGALRLAEENLPEGAALVLLGEVALSDADLVFDHVHDEDGGHSHGEDTHTHPHGDEDHTHDQAGPNPHVWTSVRNAAALVEGIADALASLDPQGAQIYADNAQAYRAQLADLDAAIEAATATIPDDARTLVTYHDAWTYFARDYHLDFATAVQPADFSEPSAAEVRDVIDLLRELDVPAIFGSEVFPTPVLETIAEETGATYVDDLADDMLPGDPGTTEHTYLELMRRNAHAIVDALGGDPGRLN